MPRVFKDGHPYFGFGGKASNASYDNAESGLEATDVQAAIDELAESGGSQNVQSDWNETDSTSDAYIQNKPTIPNLDNVPKMIDDTFPTLLNANAANSWIKIGTSNNDYGLIPSAPGSAGSGHNRIGTASWYWAVAYIDQIYGTLNGVATRAELLKYTHGNEINFSGGTQSTCFFNYRNADTGATSAINTITYRFCNYSSDTSKSTIVAGTFSGNLSGHATSATSATSATGAVHATYVMNNSVVLLGPSGGNTFMRSQTNNHNVTIQSDCNLVVYRSGSSAVWQSGTSSKRFKHNIQSMTEERARKILDIRAVTFDWNDGQVITTQKNDNAGVIAEEVSQVIPDVVVFEPLDENDGLKIERRVEYERFTPYLIKMVQMQQEQIEALTARIDILEAKLNEN